MQREIIETSDGSKTIRIIALDENYHSHHGALQEAKHVFIQYGLDYFKDKKNLSIFEMGFGTGLNAFLTAIETIHSDKKIEYTGIEAYPVSEEEVHLLGYNQLMGAEFSELYDKIHSVEWGSLQEITQNFKLHKIVNKIESVELKANFFDLIYYDAFGPRAQDEMWTVELFQKMFNSLRVGGVLVTYCAKGQVKRNLKEVGFKIEALPGPPGKREMTRAFK